MFTKLLKWNTGRGYAAEGQIIEAIFIPTRIDDDGDQVGALEFVDVTRGIDGRFENVAFTNREIADVTFQLRTLDLYDRGGYDSTQVIKLDFQGGGKYKVGYHAGAAEALAEFDDGISAKDRRPKYRGTQFETDGHTYQGYYSDTGINDAIQEAFTGGHVAHVKNPENDRVVAVRPWYMDKDKDGDDVAFTLTFSDPQGPDLRRSGDELQASTFKEAERLARNFLVGNSMSVDADYCQEFVNQKKRDCELVQLTKQRARFRYWLPNSGETFTWRQRTTVGGYHYLRRV